MWIQWHTSTNPNQYMLYLPIQAIQTIHTNTWYVLIPTNTCKYISIHAWYMQSIRIRKYKPNTEYKHNTNQILSEYVPGMYWVYIGAQIQTQYCNTYQYILGKPLMMNSFLELQCQPSMSIFFSVVAQYEFFPLHGSQSQRFLLEFRLSITSTYLHLPICWWLPQVYGSKSVQTRRKQVSMHITLLLYRLFVLILTWNRKKSAFDV